MATATTLVLREGTARDERTLKIVLVGGRYYLVRTDPARTYRYEVLAGYPTRRLADIAYAARLRRTLRV